MCVSNILYILIDVGCGKDYLGIALVILSYEIVYFLYIVFDTDCAPVLINGNPAI